MTRTLMAMGLMALLAGSVAAAQEQPGVRRTTETRSESQPTSDGSWKWGLLGLVGLAGIGGLSRRRGEEHTSRGDQYGRRPVVTP